MANVYIHRRRLYSAGTHMGETTRKSNVDRLAEMYNATSDRAFESTTLMDPDIEWQEPEGLLIGGAYRGPEQVHEVLTSVLMEFEEPVFTTDRYIDEGDTVIVFGTFTGTHKNGEVHRDPECSRLGIR